MLPWLKLHRVLADHAVMRHPNAVQLFVWCIIRAQDTRYQHSTRYGIVTLERGQLMSGRKSLSEKLGQSEQNLRTALALLIKSEMLTIVSTKGYSIITVVNYDKYQSRKDYQPSPQPTANQQLTTEVRDSKIQEEYSADFESFWQAYPKKRSKGTAFREWQKAKPDLQAVLKAIALQKSSPEWLGGYVKDPERWIKCASWNDEISSKPQGNLSKVDSQVQADRRRTAI